MAELQRLIGEEGEKVVDLLFRRIGWIGTHKTFDVPCVKSDHLGDGGKKRISHGIDFAFCYQSPLYSRQSDQVVGSIKFSTKSYPANPVSKFKKYAMDLDSAMECYQRSEKSSHLKKNLTGVDLTHYKGILIWINNQPETPSIREAVSKAQLSNKNIISILDNARFEFLWNALNYIENNSSKVLRHWSFAYHSTGHNQDGSGLSGGGNILPYELLLGGPIVFRVTDFESKKMVICTPDDFSRESLSSLLDLAMEHSGRGWASEVFICFPDYKKIPHREAMEEALASFPDKNFSQGVSVANFKSSPLGTL